MTYLLFLPPIALWSSGYRGLGGLGRQESAKYPNYFGGKSPCQTRNPREGHQETVLIAGGTQVYHLFWIYHHTGIPLVFRLDIQFFSWCLVFWVGLGDLNVIGFLKKSMVVSGSPKRW